MYHASLYTKIENDRTVCRVCRRRCSIPPGGLGYCGTRLNKGGKLMSLIYGRVSTMMVSPIEKKPMYHFYPGSMWLSVGSVGCNFRCPGCQNWEIACAAADLKGDGFFPDGGPKAETENISPELLIEIAKREGAFGISFTYNEPTLWVEYAERSMAEAKGVGLHTNWVTNGYITIEALDMIGPYLDSFRVDIKGFSERAYKEIAGIFDYKGILEVVLRAKEKWGMHVELVTNVIPGVNDKIDELTGLARWIVKEMGPDTPWHITRFFPHYKLLDIPETPVDLLEDIYKMAVDEGLHYPYLGNVSHHRGENTCCPGCGEVVISRRGGVFEESRLKGSRCPECNAEIFGRFPPSRGE
ncbi:MAG: AmmeMemoRadiSam system radical SAM enzyme [Deltaproteobacteria bacterium]|uniref:AmmeMemoRadiSam system radical SAM enzyme n=1 Tax=Candidatus Zymogenus saltonus TaxID=2844893 RepID=A0A9D8PS08_9DELT|nr:AmmeMemoRadiSam system radical SAM enzyme [Candidatus Zymogenus saltonus]